MFESGLNIFEKILNKEKFTLENFLDMGNIKITSDLDRYIQGLKALFESLTIQQN